MEKDNQLFFTKLSSNDPPKKILDGYDYLRSKSIDGDDVTVKFSEETKTYFAVYSDGNLKYRKKMDSQGTGSEKDQVFLNRDKQVIYVEEYNNNHVSHSCSYIRQFMSWINKVLWKSSSTSMYSFIIHLYSMDMRTMKYGSKMLMSLITLRGMLS